MQGRFVWAEGQLKLAPGFSRQNHRAILNSMIADGMIQPKPQNYVGGDFSADGFHGPQFDNVTILHQNGVTPTEDELVRMIQAQLGSYGRETASREKVMRIIEAVNTEDTEPEGENVGFLADPHKTLYPYLFPDGGQEMPVKVRHLLKAHVLNQLEDSFEDPDNFIYFTVYGSGVAYNWDEGGDLDIQMWVDIEKFQSLNEEKATWTMDDLLAEVRRQVQMVNFPTCKDIGLTAPNNTEEKCDGSMLIQYYPKPGKGTREENLAQKPYACLDLETNEWLVKPKAYKPTFYGLHFIEMMPKAKDMAIQAEALLDEYERNVLNWQFWFSLYSRYRNPAYQREYQESQRNAIMEKAGIKTMFEGVFGGRAEAYSPNGKGIEDERDMLQKLLEVWGIFQRLKHYARAPLPWDEQELPVAPVAEQGKKSYNVANYTSGQTTFEDSIHTKRVPLLSKWVKVADETLDPTIAQIASEAIPEPNLYPQEYQEYVNLTPVQREDYMQKINAAIDNVLEPAVGAEKQGEHYGVGVWRGQANPGIGTHVTVPPVMDESSTADLQALSAAHGLVKQQGSVSWGKPVAADTQGDDVFNGVVWHPGQISEEEIARLGHVIDQQFGDGMIGIIHGPQGAWYFVDFGGGDEAMQDVTQLLQRVDPTAGIKPLRWQGRYTIDKGLMSEPWEKSFEDAINEHPNSDVIWQAVEQAKEAVAQVRDWFFGGGMEPSMARTAAWADVMAKAQRIRDAGGVQLQHNGQQHIIGTVASGTKEGVTYNPEIWRQDPNSNTISLWDCTCPWSGFSWGRTRQWKKYEGRPCAHTLALYWEGQSSPRDDEGNAGDQMQIPGLDPYAQAAPPPTPTTYPQQPTPIDLNKALQETVVPPTMPPAQMPQNTPIIQPTTPKPPTQQEITFPGALGSWRKQADLQNGDYARINKAMIGFDDRGTQYTVPRNSIVEIIWSDPTETIAIYSLGSGPLGPHNARITDATQWFSWVPRTRGTAPKRH